MTLIIAFSPGRIHERVQDPPVLYVDVFPSMSWGRGFMYLHYRLFKGLRIITTDFFSYGNCTKINRRIRRCMKLGVRFTATD
jgi:hypothetical protein